MVKRLNVLNFQLAVKLGVDLDLCYARCTLFCAYKTSNKFGSCLRTLGLCKDIRCHIGPYFFFSLLASYQIRHQLKVKWDVFWPL